MPDFHILRQTCVDTLIIPTFETLDVPTWINYPCPRVQVVGHSSGENDEFWLAAVPHYTAKVTLVWLWHIKDGFPHLGFSVINICLQITVGSIRLAGRVEYHLH